MRLYVAHHRGQDHTKFHHREDVLCTLSRYGFIFETRSKEEGIKESLEERSPGLNMPRNKKGVWQRLANLNSKLVVLDLVDDMV